MQMDVYCKRPIHTRVMNEQDQSLVIRIRRVVGKR